MTNALETETKIANALLAHAAIPENRDAGFDFLLECYDTEADLARRLFDIGISDRKEAFKWAARIARVEMSRARECGLVVTVKPVQGSLDATLAAAIARVASDECPF